MDTRDTRRPQLEPPSVVVVSHTPAVDRPVLIGAPAREAPRTSRLRRAVLLGVVVGLLAVLAVGGWLLLDDGQGDGDSVSTTPGAGSAAPAPAAVRPLTLTVDAPTAVTAGEPADLVVHYTDGAGTYSGGTEEWGDDVGASSLTEGQCNAPTAAPGAVKGSYTATHTWAEPGTYLVKIGVSSYTCADAGPVVEDASTTVTVEVTARP